MLLYKHGEAEAFEYLYGRHSKGLYRYIYRFIGGPEARAEELLQDVFIKVINASKGYQPRAKFTTWLYGIAKNHCIDYLRKERHRKTDSLDTPNDHYKSASLGDFIPSHNSTPEEATERKQTGEILREAIATLPEEQREALFMREDLQLTFREIAEILGCPESTIKSRIRYALEHLRVALKPLGIRESR